MNVTVLNEKSPEIGEIIGIYDYNVLIFGVYLGYTSSEVDKMQKARIQANVLYYDEQKMLDTLVSGYRHAFYRLGTLEIDVRKEFSSASVYDFSELFYDSDIAYKYLTSKISCVLNSPFDANRLEKYEKSKTCCSFSVKLKEEDIKNWIVKSSFLVNLKGFYFVDENEFLNIAKKRIRNIVSEERQKYPYYENIMSVCTLTDREHLNCGEVYVCNKKLKNQKVTKVLMMYLGNDKFVQLGTSGKFAQEPVNLIKEIQESIGCINYLDTILGEHYIVDLNYESEIYEIGLSNLLLSKPQKVRKVQRHKIDKNNLEELKNDYIR